MALPDSLTYPPTCAGCGKTEDEAGRGYVYMSDRRERVAVWWHKECVPPDLKALLIANGWPWED